MAKRKGDVAVNVFLGPESALEGLLTFGGQARLDGAFKGRVEGSGCLLIGPGAMIEADIHAEEVIISGQVTGEVTADKRIEIKSPGRLKGNINAPLVVMDEGVWFEGHCTMAGAEMEKIGESKVTLLSARE